MAGESLIMQTGRAYQVCGDAFNGNLNATIDYLQLPDSSVANCDKLFRQFFHGEKVDRYATVYVRFARDAGTGALYVAQAPTEDGSNITGGAPTYEFFATGLQPNAKGQTDHLYSIPATTPGTTLIPGEGSPWQLSKSDTDGLDAVDGLRFARARAKAYLSESSREAKLPHLRIASRYMCRVGTAFATRRRR